MKLLAVILTPILVWVGTQFSVPQNPYNSVEAVAVVAAPIVAPVPPHCTGHTDICQALRDAGFNEEQTKLMVAIGRAESGLRIDAIGDQALETAKWGPSLGYWQIRTLKVDPPQCRNRQYLEWNLSHQAQCAFEISGQGRVYSPWSVYLSGAYKQYMS